MKTLKLSLIMIIILVTSRYSLSIAEPIGTTFTYEGRFMDGNEPAEGIYDLQFRLYDDPNPDLKSHVGYINEVNDCNVIDGYFTVDVDFSLGDPNIFNGRKRWLEIAYREGELKDPNKYTIV